MGSFEEACRDFLVLFIWIWILVDCVNACARAKR
jgi:hypothetical protein